MKKAKVTRRPQLRKDFLLQPSRIRMAVIYAFFFAVAVLVGMLIRVLFNRENASPAVLFSDWLTNLVIVIGGAVLFAVMDYPRWTIRLVDGDKIEGPSGALGARSLLPLDNIDWDRSGRSLGSRLKIGNAIYTLNGQRILISPWFYKPASFTDFLDRIGYSPESR